MNRRTSARGAAQLAPSTVLRADARPLDAVHQERVPLWQFDIESEPPGHPYTAPVLLRSSVCVCHC